MNIPALNPYSNSINNNINGNVGKVTLPNTNTAAEINSKSAKSNNGQGKSEKLLTSKEREFFMKMFPENSEKIMNHVLFNRSGRLQSTNVRKGMIVDGRA
ncbi:MAG: hypothetical protein HW421_1906 [Ignavibacteria bacterium]|nr:hypothetical protein [Ignavibacteria bacterium]